MIRTINPHRIVAAFGNDCLCWLEQRHSTNFGLGGKNIGSLNWYPGKLPPCSFGIRRHGEEPMGSCCSSAKKQLPVNFS
ncbi:hypothetical protein DSO57_1016701 [Entomophthora muscae]|uniref:Uncharacterized protein n=1 Tax=Entomophthora muscae TaxID=34485 RepID=A0ACC2S6U7_9FUNG|nr:hypothetical protein DSO57_1016701 [Entomophthora muscae]